MQENEEFSTNWDKAVDSFDDMNLREELLRGIYGIGFEKPFGIQQKGIVPVVKGQMLCLAPTRELAQQIHSVSLPK